MIKPFVLEDKLEKSILDMQLRNNNRTLLDVTNDECWYLLNALSTYRRWILPQEDKLEDIKCNICDRFCKWPGRLEQSELDKICSTCPLNKLDSMEVFFDEETENK